MKKVILLLSIVSIVSTSCGPEPINPDFSDDINTLKERVKSELKPAEFTIEPGADRFAGRNVHYIEINLWDPENSLTDGSEIEKKCFEIALETYNALQNKDEYENIYVYWKDKRGIANPNINSNNYHNFPKKRLESGSLKESPSDYSIGSIKIKMKKYDKENAGLFWNICINEPNLPQRCYGTISFKINYKDSHISEYSQELPQFKSGCNDYNLMNFMVLGDAKKEFIKLKNSNSKNINYISVKVMNCLSDSIPIFQEKIIPSDF